MAVLPVKANFLASRFCAVLSSSMGAEVEMREFSLRQHRTGMRGVGVPLPHCPWEHEPWLVEFQMLPQSEARRLTPIDEFTRQPKAWGQVVGESRSHGHCAQPRWTAMNVGATIELFRSGL